LYWHRDFRQGEGGFQEKIKKRPLAITFRDRHKNPAAGDRSPTTTRPRVGRSTPRICAQKKADRFDPIGSIHFRRGLGGIFFRGRGLRWFASNFCSILCKIKALSVACASFVDSKPSIDFRNLTKPRGTVLKTSR
jgi:hypothetical protein